MSRNRSLFMQSDIDKFYSDRHRMDDFLIHARLEPAFDIFKVFRERIRERVDYANSLLAEPFDFTIAEFYEFDRTGAEWPTSSTELDEIWRKRVKNDFLTLLLSGKTGEEARETLSERYNRLARRADQLDSNDVYQLFINSYTSAVEPHTSYFSPRASEDFQIRMSLSLEGIGAALQTESEYTVVRRIIPGGPAEIPSSGASGGPSPRPGGGRCPGPGAGHLRPAAQAVMRLARRCAVAPWEPQAVVQVLPYVQDPDRGGGVPDIQAQLFWVFD